MISHNAGIILIVMLKTGKTFEEVQRLLVELEEAEDG